MKAESKGKKRPQLPEIDAIASDIANYRINDDFDEPDNVDKLTYLETSKRNCCIPFLKASGCFFALPLNLKL